MRRVYGALCVMLLLSFGTATPFMVSGARACGMEGAGNPQKRNARPRRKVHESIVVNTARVSQARAGEPICFVGCNLWLLWLVGAIAAVQLLISFVASLPCCAALRRCYPARRHCPFQQSLKHPTMIAKGEPCIAKPHVSPELVRESFGKGYLCASFDTVLVLKKVAPFEQELP